MKKLFNIERVKTLSYPAFRVLMIIHFLLFILVVLAFSRVNFSVPGFSVKKLYQFPNIWQFVPWVASWFNLFLAIVVILLVSNEFVHRTFRQNVIDGLSRTDLIKGKLVVIFFIAVYTFLLVLLTGIVFGLINTRGITLEMIFGDFYVLLIYFEQAIAYMVIGMLFAVIFRNNGLSIIMFILYFVPVEPIIRRFFAESARQFFPMKIISDLTPKPEIFSMTSENSYVNPDGSSQLDFQQLGILPENLPPSITVTVSFVYIVIFIAVTLFVIRKRSL